MKKEMKREVEDALEILNGLISNYNDFFINESKPIPDEIKDTYLNVAKAFMNDLKEEDLKKYQKSSSYEDLVSKYNTLKSNVSEAESRIKEHNDKVIMLDKENKIKDMGEISSDASIKDDIITVPSEELFLVSSADDKLKYVTDKIKYVTSLEGTLEEEILIEFVDDIRPDRLPFVGYFKQNDTGVWMVNSSNGGTLYEIQDGIKWARFNRS